MERYWTLVVRRTTGGGEAVADFVKVRLPICELKDGHDSKSAKVHAYVSEFIRLCSVTGMSPEMVKFV